MTSTQLPPLTPADVRALARDEALFDRAERLYLKGAVGAPTRRGGLLLAEVQGSDPDPYQTEAAGNPGGHWRWRCTCPYFEIYGGPCKHGLALLLEWAHRPDAFKEEASLEEQLAGPARTRWLALLREMLRETPELKRLLAIEPERKRPLGRPLDLAPYEGQLDYALQHEEEGREQARHFRALLETAAGYLRVGDGANATRLTTLLVERLLPLSPRPRPLTRLLFESLTLLEAAALDTTWSAEEQASWLGQLMRWWEGQVGQAPRVAERLLDLILHSYRETDRRAVEGWLRGLLRRPRQGNRLSSTPWRQRVLRFLLAFYEGAERLPELLELCWEEGDDAFAARKLVERGEVAEARRLARTGLGSCQAHRLVAAALLDTGEPESAWQIAQEGLRYQDQGRGALLAWLAARALEQERVEQALSLAQQAWESGPSLERYQLLRESAQRAELWPDLCRDLQASLEHQGTFDLLVEALMEEEAWHSAAALLPLVGPRRDELTERLARAMAASAPAEALQLLFDLAELRAEGRSRPAYVQSAQAILGAESLADVSGQRALYEARLRAFLESHRRLPALHDELAKKGVQLA